MRRLFAFVTVLMLAACSRDAGAPLLDSRTPPALAPRFFPPDGWSFGVLSVSGAPRIRYGAAAPDGPPRADVVILPAYGESAEVYYETARELIGRGYRVWVLDGVAQGGSERFPGPHDLGRSSGFRMDATALEGLVARVIRPQAGKPLVVAASGASALAALLAAEDASAPLDGLFLWDPALAAPANAEQAARMMRWRLGGVRADGGAVWTRPTGDLSGRATLPAAWQLADPDLRMGGPAWEWILAEAGAQREALDAARAGKLKPPILIQASAADGAGPLCAGSPHCEVQAVPAAALPRHLAPDTVRNAWRDALIGFVETRIREAHAP